MLKKLKIAYKQSIFIVHAAPPTASPCSSSQSTPAAQIDLIIERADQVVNVCGVKWSAGPYAITAAEETKLRNRIADFVQETGLRSAVRLTLVTTYGLKPGMHASQVASQVVLDDLFARIR